MISRLARRVKEQPVTDEERERQRQDDEAFAAAVQAEWNVSETDPSEAAQGLLRDALIPALQSIVNIAEHSPDHKLRFDAAKYIVDRGLGTLNHANPAAAPKAPLDKFLEQVYESGR